MNPNTTQTHDVLLSKIIIHDEANGRAVLDPARVAELANLLSHEPLLHPITLRNTPGGLVLVAGRHRVAAYARLGRASIPATIHELDDVQEATLRLTENLQRVTLSPVEQARQLAEMISLNEQGVDAVASRLSRSVDWILDRLEILTWPEELIAHVHTKRITLAAAKTLARIQPEHVRAMRISDAALHGCSAATARLWLQTAHHDDPNQNAMPILSSQEPRFIFDTTTKCLCAGCNELKPIEETQLMRWCKECLSLIQTAQQQPQEMSPCLTPPVYDPPPPTQ